MKSPFADDSKRDSAVQQASAEYPQKSKEEIREELLYKKLELRNNSIDAFRCAMFSPYLLLRSKAIPISLSYIYFDDIYFFGGLLLFISMWFYIFGLNLKGLSDNILFYETDRKFSSLFKYWFYEPLDNARQPISKFSTKKLLLAILASELFISLFFFIDYLFEL